MTQLERQNNVIEAVLNQYKETSVVENYADLRIVTYVTAGMPFVRIWRGRQKNSFAYYRFKDLEQREDFINEQKEKADQTAKFKAELKAERESARQSAKVGDIFYTSWGYEQTNVDFYQVVNVIGKATVELREVKQESLNHMSHGMACDVMPIKDEFLNDEIIKRRIGNYGVKISQSATGYAWDGKPKYKSWYY